MTWIFSKYRLLLVALAVLLFTLMLWYIVARVGTNKIPSRGVFVKYAILSDTGMA